MFRKLYFAKTIVRSYRRYFCLALVYSFSRYFSVSICLSLKKTALDETVTNTNRASNV